MLNQAISPSGTTQGAVSDNTTTADSPEGAGFSDLAESLTAEHRLVGVCQQLVDMFVQQFVNDYQKN